MPISHEPDRGGPARESSRPARPLDWSRLLRVETAEAALAEIAAWLGPDVLGLRLVPRDRPRGSRVVGDLAPGAANPAELIERATFALDAWIEARHELDRSERRLASRSSELDLLQAVGRRAAESRTLEELFIATVTALHQGVNLDAALTAHRGEGGSELQLFLARPYDEAYLDALALRASRFIGERADPGDAVTRIELDGYDPARRSGRAFREEDLVLLPLMSRGQPVACLVVVPAAEPDERQLRLLYSTSNQLSMHMDRILAVQAAEADRFRSIVESMPQGVLLSDDGRRVSQANRSAEEMLRSVGCSVGDGLQAILERIGVRRSDAVRGPSGRKLSEFEAVVEGDRVWNLTFAPFRGDAGRRSGLVLVLADVTERRRIQDQLAQSEKMSSLGQMISGVAHELNNPLASILGYAQLLKLQGGVGPQTAKLETLAREAQRCRKIVENLLSFARRREPERKPLSLNQVVENVSALMRYQLRVDDVNVEQELDRDLPVIQGDAHQLEQALVNLLTNARHAIRETGGAGTVTVRTRRDASEGVLLEVEDTGAGVPEAERTRIFDPFYTTKQPGEGTGLGLALVYGIVTDHGGAIELRPGGAGGARFVIELPSGRSREAGVTPEPATPMVEGRAGRILVVDDEESLARMIADVLAGDGHETRYVLDARQALNRIAEDEYDLIITDLKMPGMNGDQLHAELRRLRPELSERVLLTTGDTFGDEPEAVKARTGLEVLRKPFELDELRRRVRARLASRNPGV